MGIRLVLLFLFISGSIKAEPNYLKECWRIQGKKLASKYITFAFQEKCTILDSSQGVIMQRQYDGLGRIWCNATEFLKKDTLQNNRRISTSTLFYNKKNSDYKSTTSEKKSINNKSTIEDYICYNARYIPIQLISYALKHHAKMQSSSDGVFAIYTFQINEATVQIYIGKKSFLIHHIYILKQDLGKPKQDQLISYMEYINMGDIKVARSMRIEKWSGMVTDEIVLLRPTNTNELKSSK